MFDRWVDEHLDDDKQPKREHCPQYSRREAPSLGPCDDCQIKRNFGFFRSKYKPRNVPRNPPKAPERATSSQVARETSTSSQVATETGTSSRAAGKTGLLEQRLGRMRELRTQQAPSSTDVYRLIERFIGNVDEEIPGYAGIAERIRTYLEERGENDPDYVQMRLLMEQMVADGSEDLEAGGYIGAAQMILNVMVDNVDPQQLVIGGDQEDQDHSSEGTVADDTVAETSESAGKGKQKQDVLSPGCSP